MNVLVTGGAGFIGSSLIPSLIQEGHHVICLDNFDPFYDPGLKRQNIAFFSTYSSFSLVEGDIRDESTVLKSLSMGPVDLVVHLAARAGVRPSIREPRLYYDVNVNGTLNLLECMRQAGVRRMIFASSSSVYGNNSKVPFSEKDSVDHPVSPYAASKKAGELICHTYHHLYGFDVSCLRFFTVYGPRQRPEMAIHKFTNLMIRNEPIDVYDNGLSERDYSYIDDIVTGIMAAVRKLKGYEVINLGNSHTVVLRDLVGMIEELLGRKARIRFLPHQPGDVDKTYADIDRALQILEWKPETGLPQGLKRFMDWKMGSL